MKDSLISVIVPIYNAEEYLDRCIKSIIEQTYSNLEIVLVNDGSTDLSLDICNKYAEVDKRIKVINKKNGGVSAARNDGIRVSTGEYLMVLDSDDWWNKDMCKTMLSVLIKGNLDCVICGAHQTSGNVWAPQKDKVYNSLQDFKKDFVYWLNTELLGPSWNKIFKRDKITEYYPEDMSFGEDLIFCLRYLKTCNSIAFIRNDLYQHEVFNKESLTHKFNYERFNNIERIQSVINCFIDGCNDKSLISYEKYIKDLILLVRRLEIQEDVSFNEKRAFLKRWYEISCFKSLNVLKFNMIWQNKLLLFSLKMKWFTIVYWIVNIKKYIKNIFS